MAKTRSQTLADNREEERKAQVTLEDRSAPPSKPPVIVSKNSATLSELFQAHDPVIVRPISTRHVRWIERELIANTWDKIWTRKFVEAVNEVHQLLVDKWPQYAFPDRGDAELAEKLTYLRKEASMEVRDWLARFARLQSSDCGEYFEEIFDLGERISPEEYALGAPLDVGRRHCYPPRELHHNGVYYVFDKSVYEILRHVRDKFSLNTLLKSGRYPLGRIQRPCM
ncbi:hypothetical protein VNI00_019088 [Paramarasmius palmivorus]|uniref:Uncharacterized protein n=1 Tax=Paramarasmius palmivorus TaxID=297713 RepID=A0AAW0ARA5_9AGAR